jgi:hypothetical protein
MKKIILSAILVLFALGAFAQKNVVKLNLVGACFGSYTLAYERVINSKASVQLSVGYRIYSYTLLDFKYSYTGPTIVGEFRYYLTNKSMEAPKGLYVAPFVRYGTYDWKVEDDGSYSGTPGYYNCTYTTSTIGGGAMFGYQFIVAKHLALDLFIGPQYKTKTNTALVFSNPNVVDDPSAPTLDTKLKAGVGVRTGFNLGFAF